MDGTEDTVLHAIDRTLTDLLPDKHQYEPDVQLYLDYSLPPHPDLATLKKSEQGYADDHATDCMTLPEDSPSGRDPSWEESPQRALPDQSHANTSSFTQYTVAPAVARPVSPQTTAEGMETVGAHEDSSFTAGQSHEPSDDDDDDDEGVDEGHTFPWPAVTPPSDASKAMVPPTAQALAAASHESIAAIQESPGYTESLQQVPEPHASEQAELPLEPSHDAGHLMPLTSLEAGSQGRGANTQRRMLMQAVSTLKMENACLVDALSTRISEVEALRSALSDARDGAQAGEHQVSSGAQQADGPAHDLNHASSTATQAFVMNDRAEQRFRQLEIKVGQLRAERARYERALRREVGEDVPLQKVLDEASDWRGRAQHIVLLQERLLSAQESQGEAGKAQRSKHDQQHRDNLVRLRGEKQRDIDRLRTGLEDCQACLAVSQGKEQTLTSRKRMLEKEVKGLRQKIGLLLDKSATDDKLISALRVPMAQYAPAAAGMPGPSDSLHLDKDTRTIIIEEGRGAATPEHPIGLGRHDSGNVKPLVVPLLRLQPGSHPQGGKWSHASDAPCGDASESASPVHRVSFAISMDISALSGTSSNVEIVPMTETLIHSAHAQLCPSRSSIPRPEAASWQDEGPGATRAIAEVMAGALCSRTGEGEEGTAGASVMMSAENGSTLGIGQKAEEAALNHSDEGKTPQKMHQEMTANNGQDTLDWVEVMPGELRDEQLAPNIPENESDTSQALLAGFQETAGDDRLAKALHQGLDHEEGSLSQTAPTGCTPLLPRKDRQGLITETPRGIVAKLVVDRIIAEL